MALGKKKILHQAADTAVVNTDHFDIVTYEGNGGTKVIDTLDFQPDLVWVKVRDASTSHVWVDSVRGRSSVLYSNLSSRDFTSSASNDIVSFDSNGFTLGADQQANANTNGNDHVAWCWKAGGTAVSNTDGSITSQVSANQDAGFSIVNGSGNTYFGGSLGHGLSQAPELIITKQIDGANNWYVYHKDLTTPNNYYLFLNSTAAEANYGSNIWNVTSTTILSDLALTNQGVSYCFHSVSGYQKVGSYTGDDSTSGNIITTGFQPRWIMIKNASQPLGNWNIFDAVRDPSNTRDSYLAANSSAAEGSLNSIDFLSNGFELRSGLEYINNQGDTYIYLAIA